MLTQNDYAVLRAEFAKHPCEICGAPSTGQVWDFLRPIHPGRIVPDPLEGNGPVHWFCDAHYRESRITDVVMPIQFE